MSVVLVKIVHVSVKDENSKWWKEFEELRWRDRKSLSSLIQDACEEYFQHHKDGNPQFSLDLFKDPDFEAWPALGSNPEKLRSFYKKLSKEEYKKLDSKLNQYISFHNEAWEKM